MTFAKLSRRVSGLGVLLALGAIGCGDDGTAPADAGMMEMDAGAMACMGEEPTCVDQQLTELTMFETASDAAAPTNEDLGDGLWRTTIDSTGGGFNPSEAYVYLRFTETGVEKVDVSDYDSFESSEWDFSVRRFILRLNSGVAGPSCVTGARTASGTEIETLDAVPEGLSYRAESYYTEDCSYVDDGAGIGSPGVALASFWRYEGCVQMTGNVYVIELANGRHVKLEVETYYSASAQQTCNETGSAPMPSGSGNFQILWGYLD